MKIDLKTIYAGPGGTISPGKVEVDDETGKALVQGGYAVSLEVEKPVEEIENATISQPEKAVSKRGRKRKK